MHYSASTNAFYPGELKEAYQAAGSWPEDAVTVTDEEWQVYGIGQPPAEHRRAADENGRPCWAPVPPPSIENLAAQKRAAIEASLAAELAAGMPYIMPDGTPEVVQTRHEDEPNLLGLAIEARDNVIADVTDPVHPLRVLSNRMYLLTPDEMIAVTDAAAAFKKEQLAHSWELKDQIIVAQEAGDRAAIEAITW